MAGALHQRVAFALVAVLSSASAGARAADSDGDEPGPPRPSREWVGLEVIPLSYTLTQVSPTVMQEDPAPRFNAAPGGAIRLFRHRWERFYAIPIRASLFVSENEVIFAELQTEGGLIVPGTDRRLELGVGLGLGVLAIKYGNHCDGYCNQGGTGPLISPIARFLFYNTPTVSAGVNVRAVVPVARPRSDLLSINQWGSVFFAALEIGFGGGGSRPN